MSKSLIYFQFLFLLSCDGASQVSFNLKGDFKHLKIKTKSNFEFNSVLKSDNDTLDLVSCAKYILYPFGIINDEAALDRSLLNRFSIISRNNEDSLYFYYELKYGNNKIIFFSEFDENDSEHSNILNGEINDSDIVTINNIHVGMSVSDFYNRYFDYYPMEIETKYKIIILRYCVEGIKHIYKMDNGRLKQIKFE